MAADELDVNPFYHQLQVKFKKKLDRGQEHCHLLCIPQSTSITGAVFNQDFVDCHILAPSAYFKDQFITTDKKATKTIQIEKDQILLISGFEASAAANPIKILWEECAYNKEFNPFRILVIERPLTSDFKMTNSLTASEELWKFFNSEPNLFNLSKKFFHLTPKQQKVLQRLDSRLEQFKKNYMVLPNYLEDAASKLSAIASTALQESLANYSEAVMEDSRLKTKINLAIESYIMGNVHSIIFPATCQRFHKDDMKLNNRLMKLNSLNIAPDQLGVRDCFCCPQPAGIVELASLDLLKTPYEKLECLRNTIDHITAEIKLSLQENYSNFYFGKEDIPVVTTDDLIPILAVVVIQSKCCHLVSNLYYIDNFRWNNSSADNLSYALVSFQAVVEFIQSTDFSNIKPTTTKIKKELSLEELMEVTEQLQVHEDKRKNSSFDDTQDSSNPNTLTSNAITLTPLDRRLKRITKMIEASTKELQGLENLGVPECKAHERRSSFEEFTCSIPGNVLGINFGKQS